MRYVAFLRAINTGSRRIKMLDLRSVYGELGYQDVSTHIATGNVIFEAPSPPPTSGLEHAFTERFGFASEVFLRSGEEVRSIVEAVPWSGVDDVIEVSFLEREPDIVQARALEATSVAPEELFVAGREVYFLRGLGRGVPTTHKESTSMEILDMKMTRRGLRTIAQIWSRYLLPEM